MQDNKISLILVITMTLAACSAHSPFIMTSTTDVVPAKSVAYPAHTNKVYVTQANLPDSVKYEV